MSKMDSSLFELLEEILKDASEPLTCVKIYERQDVRSLTASSNRVSDYLGALWRKGKASRSTATPDKNDGSRWAYSWRHKVEAERDQPGFDKVIHMIHEGPPRARILASKPNVVVTELNGEVTIELAGFTITVRPK